MLSMINFLYSLTNQNALRILIFNLNDYDVASINFHNSDQETGKENYGSNNGMS